MPITTGSVPKTLWGARPQPQPTPNPASNLQRLASPGSLRDTVQSMTKINPYTEAFHNDGGTAHHCGSGCAFPSHGH